MNNDTKRGLILFGSTLAAGLFIAAAWTGLTTGSALVVTGLVIMLWTVVNLASLT